MLLVVLASISQSLIFFLDISLGFVAWLLKYLKNSSTWAA